MQPEAFQKYCSLFLHNTSLYIIHTGSTWLTVKQEVTPELIKKHLERQIVIGLCPQKDDGTVKWVAIDFDAHNGEPIETIKENVKKTKENLTKVNINSHLEQSGRGYHLWLFFEEPILRERIERFIGQFIYHSAELYAGKTKIRIPLGCYQKDKSIFCDFLDDDFNLIKNQEQYLLNIKPTNIEAIRNARNQVRENKSILLTKPISENKKRTIVTNQKWFTFDKEKKEVITKPEINKNKVLEMTDNEKHKLILRLLFEMNLSPLEIRNLKVKDISLNEQLLSISKYKTNERKMLLVPGYLLEPLKNYLANKMPDDLLLTSARGKRYNVRTIEMIRSKNIEKLNLAPENNDSLSKAS